jgi:catechol 2,3-dioxygenase-like lactoylglutathione lyase family enzyme
MALGGVHHVAVQVTDLERARAFYVDVLGFAETRRQPHSIWVQSETGPSATIVMLERCDGAHDTTSWASPRQGLHLLAFAIDVNMRDAWRAKLEQHGVHIEKQSAFSLFFFDPDGTRLALSHYPKPSAGQP